MKIYFGGSIIFSCTQSMTRTPQGIMYHVLKTIRMKSRNPRRRNWTEEEHKRFEEAMVLYAGDTTNDRQNWFKIQEHVGTRSAEQIRSHAQKYFARMKATPRARLQWSHEEEESLRKGVKKYGAGKWRFIKEDPVLGKILNQRSNVDLMVSPRATAVHRDTARPPDFSPRRRPNPASFPITGQVEKHESSS